MQRKITIIYIKGTNAIYISVAIVYSVLFSFLKFLSSIVCTNNYSKMQSENNGLTVEVHEIEAVVVKESDIKNIIVEELSYYFEDGQNWNRHLWTDITFYINERFEGIKEYSISEIFDLFYKDIVPGFPDLCNYGITDVEMVKNLMILKTLPHTLEEFNDKMTDDDDKKVDAFVEKLLQEFKNIH